MSVRIETRRFFMRELSEQDATQRYLDWFRDPATQTYVSAAAAMATVEDLQRYIAARSGRHDVAFLGIFDKASGTHVGNVKYEPVDTRGGYAIVGILIGDSSYRGKGVAVEVLAASGRWLKEHRGIRQIALGVHRSNTGAIRAYEKVGYRIAPTPYIPSTSDGTVTMVWAL
jgi:[ribosomal protein S5]-alanine N-acetyltransferase